jgi:hypothetical protein
MMSLNKLWPRALSAAAFLVALAAPIGALAEQVWFAPPDNLQRSTRTVLSPSIRPPPGARKPMSSSFHHSWAVSSVQVCASKDKRLSRRSPHRPGGGHRRGSDGQRRSNAGRMRFWGRGPQSSWPERRGFQTAQGSPRREPIGARSCAEAGGCQQGGSHEDPRAVYFGAQLKLTGIAHERRFLADFEDAA